MLYLFTLAKRSFLIVQSKAVTVCLCLYGQCIVSVSLVSILPIIIKIIMHNITIAFKSMWWQWLRWDGGCFFERLSDGSPRGNYTFSPPYHLCKNARTYTHKKTHRHYYHGVGYILNRGVCEPIGEHTCI